MDDWTRNDLHFHLRYSLRFGERQARFYERADAAIKFVSLLSGLGAFVGLIGQSQLATGISGFIVGVLSFIDVLWKPTERAFNTKALRARYEDLATRASRLSDETLRAELERLDASDAPQLEGLRPVAYNDIVRERYSTEPPKDQLMHLEVWNKIVHYLT